MANTVSTSTMYVDSTGTVNTAATVVKAIFVTTSATAAVLTLADASTDDTKITIKVADSGVTEFYDLSACPLIFPNGVKIAAVTNAEATLIYNLK